MPCKNYNVKRTATATLSEIDFAAGETVKLLEVRPESSYHHPEVLFTLVHDGSTLYLRFTVFDHKKAVRHSQW